MMIFLTKLKIVFYKHKYFHTRNSIKVNDCTKLIKVLFLYYLFCSTTETPMPY